MFATNENPRLKQLNKERIAASKSKNHEGNKGCGIYAQKGLQE